MDKVISTRGLVLIITLLGVLLTVLGGGAVFQRAILINQYTLIDKLHQTAVETSSVNEYRDHIYNLSVEFGFDPLIVELVTQEARGLMQIGDIEWRLIRTPEYLTYLMLSLIAVESNGNTWAIGDKGKARGLTQIWTTTAKIYDADVTAAALLNPQVNITISFQHFHALLKKYEGNFGLVLYAWNRGSGKVDKLLAYGRTVENGYGRKVYMAALNRNGDIFND